MNVIVWTQPDQTVAVCVPTGEIPIEEVLAKDVPAGVTARVIDISDLPLPLNDPAFGLIRMSDDGTTFTVLPEPPPPPPPTPEQKLAAAGLTVAELKQLLGIV